MKAIRLLLLDFHDIDIDDSKPRTEKEKKEMVCLETSGSSDWLHLIVSLVLNVPSGHTKHRTKICQISNLSYG